MAMIFQPTDLNSALIERKFGLAAPTSMNTPSFFPGKNRFMTSLSTSFSARFSCCSMVMWFP